MSYTIEKLLELAVAAGEVNSFSTSFLHGYVKSSYPLYQSVFGEVVETDDNPPDSYKGMYDDDPYVFSNRDLIKEHLGDGRSITRWHPERHCVPELIVTDEIKQQAQDIIKHFRATMTFKAVSENLNDFEKKIFTIMTEEELTGQDIGIVASLPASYKRETQHKLNMEKKAEVAKGSKYIGEVGKMIDLSLSVTSHRWLSKFDCFVVNGIANDTDVVAFFTQKNDAIFGSKCDIRAKIKRQSFSEYSHAEETFLHYVKVIQKHE